MGMLKSIPLKSDKNPLPIKLFHEGIIISKNYSYTEYEVRGTVFSIDTNTRLEVEKRFSELSDAEIYFGKIIKEFPKSEIVLKSINVKEIKVYV